MATPPPIPAYVPPLPRDQMVKVASVVLAQCADDEEALELMAMLFAPPRQKQNHMELISREES